MASRPLWLLLPFTACAFAAAVACTHTVTTAVPGDDDDDSAGDASSTPPLDSGLGILTMKPNTMYSGFDGTHGFKVPFAMYSAGSDLTVTASDPSLASLAPTALVNPVTANGTDSGQYYMITVLGAGDVTITATSGGKTVTGTLHIASYTAASWTTGQGRYTAGPDANNPPCTQCHAGASAVDHSPAALAGVPDNKVSAIITTGISTEGFPIKINGAAGHMWETTPDQLTGLVTYLRALDPKGFK